MPQRLYIPTHRIPFLPVLLSIVLSPGCNLPGDSSSGITPLIWATREANLLKFHDGERMPGSMDINWWADGHCHFMFPMRIGEKTVMVCDGVSGRQYDEIHTINGPEGMMYQGRIGSKWSLIGGPVAIPLTFDKIGAVYVSPDGRRIAFYAEDGGEKFLVVDGKKHPVHAEPTASLAQERAGGEIGHGIFTADSKHVVYVADTERGQRVVVDGVPEPEYYAVGYTVAMDKSGQHLAYAAKDFDGDWFVVQDGHKTSQKYDDVSVVGYLGSQLVQYRVEGGKCQIILGNRKVGPDSDDWGEASVAGNHLVFSAKVGEKWFMIMDGEMSGPWKDIYRGSGGFQWSNNHKRSAFFAWRETSGGAKALVVIDGKESAGWDALPWNPGTLAFNADSKHVAYCAKDGDKWCVVVDGAIIGGYESVGSNCGAQTGNVFVGKGNHVAYAGKKDGKWSLFVDGRPLQTLDVIGTNPFENDENQKWGLWAINEDGRHSVYFAEVAKELVGVVDGKVYGHYDSVVGGPIFTRGGEVEFLAIRNRTMYRVNMVRNLKERGNGS